MIMIVDDKEYSIHLYEFIPLLSPFVYFLKVDGRQIKKWKNADSAMYAANM